MVARSDAAAILVAAGRRGSMSGATPWATSVTELLGIDVPVVLAPMGGGPCTPGLVAAVSNAGGLGFVAAGYLSADRIEANINEVRRLTSAPFGVNLFAGTPPVADPAAIERAVAVIGPLRQELGLPARAAIPSYAQSLAEQLEAVVAVRPAAVSFTFGLLAPAAVNLLHAAGCIVIGTATTVAEAVAVESSGADGVCVQGADAGAHRGTFLRNASDSLVGTLSLVPQVCDAVSIPVVASGGVMDGRGLAAVLALGAGGAQLGTAFLRCPEAGTSKPYREALAATCDTSTALTSAVTGRMARGIENRLMSALAGLDVPPYPVMNAITAELRQEAGKRGDAGLMSLWCGQGVALGTELPAADLVRQIASEGATILAKMVALVAGQTPR